VREYFRILSDETIKQGKSNTVRLVKTGFSSPKIRKKGLLGFSPAKNDANSAQRKEKGYARFGKYPVCFS